ncbi:hypothetical protein N8I74_15835 [Chitiniphilus purpureus]|uniref:DUF669 domain-containing protein n=1 Tax=Chitiniphilus purpureus TaxID=2981137 RepID=A0ABY6DK79_9NEIS|nr:hypothetical protein [Chitiniphilus sp. CD1]UXY14774.1 hypothetical protein N8I74_15835 [Chitiniphilus sp. CD1]
MALTIKHEPTSNFEHAPAGTFPARCVRLIDMGTQVTEYQGRVKHQQKVLISFELLGDERMSDGRPFIVSKRYTASLHEKSAFRKDLASWRGRDFTDEELSGFDVRKLLNAPCLLGIVVTEKDGKEFSDISSIMKLPKGMEVDSPHNAPVCFDLNDPDWGIFEALSNGLKEAITKSPEYHAAKGRSPIADHASARRSDDFEEDIPF